MSRVQQSTHEWEFVESVSEFLFQFDSFVVLVFGWLFSLDGGDIFL